MNFCYCIGGSAARVAEAAAHLCAMNLTKGEDVTFVIADKDSKCGGTIQARNVIESVAALSGEGNTSLKRSSKIVQDGRREFCKSNLKIKTWNFSKHVGNLSNDEIESISLKSALSSRDHNMQINDAILFDAFYSNDDQERDTEKGFYGRPAIGSLIFKYMIKEGKWNGENSYHDDDIAYPVKEYLRENIGEKVRVFIVGSIFGGTGASLFSNLAAHIRTSVSESYQDRLTISGCLLLPYFNFVSKEGDLIDPQEFYVKSKEALTQYAADKNLLKKDGNKKGYFDSIYVCGQHPLHTTGEVYSIGGDTQKNHFDLIDLVGAKAMTEFFACKEDNLGEITNGKVFEYRLMDAQDGELSYMTLSGNTTGLLREMLTMLSFCSFVMCKIYAPIKLDGNTPDVVDFYRSLFKSNELVSRKGFLGTKTIVTGEYQTEIYPAIEAMTNSIVAYCNSYLRFLYDISKNGHNWSETDDKSKESMYSLFDSDYIFSLQKISSLIAQGSDSVRSDIDSFSSKRDRIKGMENAGASPNDVEEALQIKFNGKADMFKNGDVSATARLGDYIHEAFAICYEKAGAQ